MEALVRVFPAAHPVFIGHFPGHPIVPGVMLLDWAQSTVESVLGYTVTGLTEAKFLSPATPDEDLMLTLDAATGGGFVRFDIRCGERKVASGRFAVSATVA